MLRMRQTPKYTMYRSTCENHGKYYNMSINQGLIWWVFVLKLHLCKKVNMVWQQTWAVPCYIKWNACEMSMYVPGVNQRHGEIYHLPSLHSHGKISDTKVCGVIYQHSNTTSPVSRSIWSIKFITITKWNVQVPGQYIKSITNTGIALNRKTQGFWLLS